ncbi:MAG: BatD family protein [Phycisphaerales bacterium]|nr:BatD family protein [Planctomycetota bacterium]MCH8508673.1 BatD family protein [Phycisphaerales bacterium]
MIRWITVMVWLLGLVTPCAAASDSVSVSAELSRARAYVGDEVVYQVVVRGGRPATRPSVAFPGSVRAFDAGQSESSRQYFEVIDGRTVRVSESSIVYQFRVTPLEPGMVEIPAAEVTLPDGRRLRTDPVRFEALLPRLASGFEVRVETDRTRVYLGETINARVIWTITDRVGNFDFDTSVFDPTLRIEPAPGAGRDVTEFRFRGQRAFGTAEQVFEAGGRQSVRFTFHVRITPTQAGMRAIGPVRVVFDRESTTRGARERVYTESDVLTLDVRGLPSEGRPAGFGGLIGRYELRTLASPTTVNVGDPITLRAELRGNEPMVGADGLPALDSMPGFERFRVSSEGWRAEESREAGRRVFTTTIRALTHEVSSIPPVIVYAFDPHEGRYEAVSSDPIQIEVRAVRETTLADAVMSPGTSPGVARGVIGPGDPAFWAAPSVSEVISARGFRAAAALGHPAAVGAMASGPLAIVGAWLFVAATRRRAEPWAVRDRALRRAGHTVVRSGAGAGAREACAAVLGCDAGAVTAADVERLPAHPGIIRTLREAIEPDEQGRPSGGPGPEHTRLAIRALRRSVRESARGGAGERR